MMYYGIIKSINAVKAIMTNRAYATLVIQTSKDQHGMPCLKGVCDLDDDHGTWLGFFTVFDYTANGIYEAAYSQAASRVQQRGYRLETFKLIEKEAK